MPRVKKVANTSVASKSGVSVPAGNVRIDNLKNMQGIEEEKNVNSKKSEDETEQKSKYDASQMTVGENTNISEEKNLSREIPKGKTAAKRKIKDVNESKSKTDKNKKDVDGIAENSEQDKNADAENPKRKTAVHPPISEMVVESLRSLRKRNGATAEEINIYIEENYQVNISRIKHYIIKFLQKGVADGLFEQINESGAERKFKIKETGIHTIKITDRNKSKKKSITATKRKFETVNESETEMDANPEIVDGNAENSDQDKNISAEYSKRKTATHPPTSEMVMESFRKLRKRNGTSAEEIAKYIEENYQVNINRIKPHINRFLQKGVANGLFENKFHMKRNSKNLKSKQDVSQTDINTKDIQEIKKNLETLLKEAEPSPSKEENLSYFI